MRQEGRTVRGITEPVLSVYSDLADTELLKETTAKALLWIPRVLGLDSS